jgi:hypothetical protein
MAKKTWEAILIILGIAIEVVVLIKDKLTVGENGTVLFLPTNAFQHAALYAATGGVRPMTCLASFMRIRKLESRSLWWASSPP